MIILELWFFFYEGMIVLIGEIGVGKFIIIDVLGLLVGGRGLSDYIC